MSNVHIRKSVKGYVRDSYLGSAAEFNQTLSPIDCAIGSSQWGMSDRAIAAHRAHDPSTLARYADPFHERLAHKIHERFGLSKEQAPLFFGHGSFNLAERVIHKLIEPTVMIGVGPQFNEIPSEFVAAGGSYRPVPLSGPRYDFPLERIKQLAQEGASVIYLDNPNNPTGQLLSLGAVAHIAEHAAQHGVMLLVDEAYGDFVDDSHSSTHLVRAFPNMIVIRSFSKALGLAAARVGYMFMSPEIAVLYRNLDVPFEPTLHSAELALATLEDSDFISGVRKQAAESKSFIMPILLERGFEVLPTHPQTSILTACLKGGNAVRAFASISVTVEPGSAFVQTNGSWDDSYCRLRLPPREHLTELAARIRSLQLSGRISRSHAHQP
jgi:histidinol-phosphate aminotransferase